MKAVVFTRYGGPDVLRLEDVARPVPKDDEVLVRVHAAALNDWDWAAMQGIPLVNRFIFGLRKPAAGRQILGSDIAGRVEAIGKDVRQFRAGDAVFGDTAYMHGRWGGLAQYACVRQTGLALKAPGMSFEEAAAIPQAGLLAMHGIRDAAKLEPGQRLLINGAGGGVGTFALQVVRPYGLEVTAVDHASKLDMLRSLGATHVIDYKREDFTSNGKQYDLIFDVKTNRPVGHYARALVPNGKYVTIGGTTSGLLQVALLGPLVSLTRGKTLRLVGLSPKYRVTELKEFFEARKIVPVIDGPYKLDDVPRLFQYFGDGRHKGKVVVTID